MIDNYDSFTYNLVQYFAELGQDVAVYRNDEISVEQVRVLSPEYIVIGPGPCSPVEAEGANAIIRTFAGKIPMLGVCLGHQCMGHVFGGKVLRAPTVMHGKTASVFHTDEGMFSWIIKSTSGGTLSFVDRFAPAFATGICYDRMDTR